MFRYYALDNNYYFETRDTCTYRMNSTERENLEYEDGEPILDVVYQFVAKILLQKRNIKVLGVNVMRNIVADWTVASVIQIFADPF